MTTFENLARKCSKGVDSFDERRLYTVGRWHKSLGRLQSFICEIEDAPCSSEEDDVASEMAYHLRDIASGAAIMLSQLGVTDPAAAFVDEYAKASAKHPGMTLDSDKHTNESRFYALGEEVGEVCAALTYDNKKATGHNSDLISEVTQVGGLAIAWLLRYQEGNVDE